MFKEHRFDLATNQTLFLLQCAHLGATKLLVNQVQ